MARPEDLSAGLQKLDLEAIPDLPSADEVTEYRPSKTPIQSFPLPQELKDEIYSYLLDANNTSKIVKTASALHDALRGAQLAFRKYKFSTHLLYLNKAIGKEAEAYLYTNNIFVKVKCNIAGFWELLRLHDVPMLTARACKHFTNINYEISIAWRSPPEGASGCQEHPHCRVGVSSCFEFLGPVRQEVLMLARDLPKFFRTLKFILSIPQVPACYIVSDPQDSFQVSATNTHPAPNIRFTLRSTPYHKVKADEQAEFLNLVRDNMMGAGYDMTMKEFDDLHRVAEVKEVTAPRLVWLSAVMWSHIEVFSALKEEADVAALDGDLQLAVARYRLLQRLLSHGLGYTCIKDVALDGLGMDAAAGRWNFLGTDVSLSIAYLYLRIGDLEAAQAAAGSLGSASAVWPLSSELSCQVVHLQVLIRLTAIAKHKVANRGELRDMRWRASAALAHGERQLSKHEQHDMNCLQDCLNATYKDCYKHISLDALSVRALPLRLFKSQDTCDVPLRPDGFVGWTDTKHLAAFSDDDKKEVRKLQKKMKYPLTAFD